MGLCNMVEGDFICNMDQMAVFFESKLTQTVHRKSDETIPVQNSCSNQDRMTVCLAITPSGKKLVPFIIFKGVPGGRIVKSLLDLLPDGVHGCCQEDGWMDEQNAPLWIAKVWKPYAEQVNNSFLLLDTFKCHMQSGFTEKLSDVGTEMEYIPASCTS